jgi:hypothetical protein
MMDIQPLYEEFAMSKYAHSADRYDALLTEIATLRQQLAEQTSLHDEREAFEFKVCNEFEQPPSLKRDGDGYDDGYIDNAWWGWKSRAELSTPPSVEVLLEALRNLIDNKQSSYKARNGKEVHLQGDDGEKMWISSSDDFLEVEHAINAYSSKPQVTKGE